jgi:hypothetical protein
MRWILSVGASLVALWVMGCGDDEETSAGPGGTGGAGTIVDCSSFEFADTKAIAALAYANDIKEEVVTGCSAIALALGASPPAPSQPPTAEDATLACTAAAEAIEVAVAAAIGTDVGVVIPECEPNAASQASCEVECPACKVCELDAALDAACAPAATVTVISTDETLVSALETNLPALLELQARLDVLLPAFGAATEMVTAVGSNLPEECTDPVVSFGKNLADAAESAATAAEVGVVLGALP